MSGRHKCVIDIFLIASLIVTSYLLYLFDMEIVLYVVGHRNKNFDLILRIFTIYGNYILALIEVAYLVIYHRDEDRRDYNIAIIASLVGWCVSSRAIIAIKSITVRPRPYMMDERISVICDRPSDYSFPSGHANAATSLTTPIILTSRNMYVRILLILYVILMCFSRIYCGVHYPTDVLWGAIIGYVVSKSILSLITGIAR